MLEAISTQPPSLHPRPHSSLAIIRTTVSPQRIPSSSHEEDWLRRGPSFGSGPIGGSRLQNPNPISRLNKSTCSRGEWMTSSVVVDFLATMNIQIKTALGMCGGNSPHPVEGARQIHAEGPDS